jgi:hypothetical protein
LVSVGSQVFQRLAGITGSNPDAVGHSWATFFRALKLSRRRGGHHPRERAQWMTSTVLAALKGPRVFATAMCVSAHRQTLGVWPIVSLLDAIPR